MLLGSAFRPPTVGLDIGSSAIKAVVLRRSRSGWSLVKAGEAPLPDGSVQNGSAAEPTAVSEAVSGLLDSMHLRRAQVAAALSGHAVIVKRLSLPAMTQAELNEAIPWEAEQYIPFDLSEVQLDYQVVNQSDASKTSLDVLLVAAKRDRIEDRTGVIAQTGRRPVVLDIEAFALANAYQMNYPDRATDTLTALIHIGRSLTIVCLLERGEPVFTRDISIGGQVHVDALLQEFGPSGLDDMAAKRILYGHYPREVSEAQAAGILRDASSQLVAEVRKTIDFYRATAPVEKLTRVVLSGGGCEAVGLSELFSAEFDAPVEVFDPFRRVSRPDGALASDAAAPSYAVAVGLAMRREADR